MSENFVVGGGGQAFSTLQGRLAPLVLGSLDTLRFKWKLRDGTERDLSTASNPVGAMIIPDGDRITLGGALTIAPPYVTYQPTHGDLIQVGVHTFTFGITVGGVAIYSDPVKLEVLDNVNIGADPAVTSLNGSVFPVPIGTVVGEPLILAGDIPGVTVTGRDSNGDAYCATYRNGNVHKVLVVANTGTIVLGDKIYHDETTAYNESGLTTPLTNNNADKIFGHMVEDVTIDTVTPQIVDVILREPA